MKFIVLTIALFYMCAMGYVYFTQDSQIFNRDGIDAHEPFVLDGMENVSLHVDGAVLDGVYRRSLRDDAPLILYFGGNADDATRILLRIPHIDDYDIASFNYRGYIKSTGTPSQKALFSDALSIYDTYAKERQTILIGRSLGTGVATYLASKRQVKGVILITPFDSLTSIAKKKYPFFPINLLLNHPFNSIDNVENIGAPIGLIEVADDAVVTKYHFERLKAKIPHIASHVTLQDTTHAQVLTHPDFEKTIDSMLKEL